MKNKFLKGFCTILILFIVFIDTLIFNINDYSWDKWQIMSIVFMNLVAVLSIIVCIKSLKIEKNLESKEKVIKSISDPLLDQFPNQQLTK